jgi:hypothetical protein
MTFVASQRFARSLSVRSEYDLVWILKAKRRPARLSLTSLNPRLAQWRMSVARRRQKMARITIEEFDATSHGNPMWYIDDAQRERHNRAPTLVPYKVCLVDVCGFTFVFHSLLQLRLCLEYYSQDLQPSSRLPVYDKNLGGDHWESQRWFEKLPQYLLEKPKRSKVVAALTKALVEYSRIPGAETETPKKPLNEW